MDQGKNKKKRKKTHLDYLRNSKTVKHYFINPLMSDLLTTCTSSKFDDDDESMNSFGTTLKVN